MGRFVKERVVGVIAGAAHGTGSDRDSGAPAPALVPPDVRLQAAAA